MSMIKYDGDNRTYIRYKKNGDPHYYVECTSTKIDGDGNKRICSYIGKREDRHKTNVSHGKLHKCVFIIKKQELTLHNFFETEKTNKPENEFSEEGVKQRLAILAGKKKLIN